MDTEIDDYTQEEVVVKKEDWRIKDNIIQALNLIIRDRLSKNYNTKFVTYHELVGLVRDIKKQKNCTSLEASVLLKEKVRKEHEKLKNKKK